MKTAAGPLTMAADASVVDALRGKLARAAPTIRAMVPGSLDPTGTRQDRDETGKPSSRGSTNR